MANTFDTIQTELGGGVLTIRLNRPDALNAINNTMLTELSTALRLAQREAGARCVMLTGAGRSFCAGQDLKDLEATSGDPTSAPDLGALLRTKYNPLILRLRALEKPVVVALNGIAAGAGVSLALAADLRVASASAALDLAFVRVGLVPDAGATQMLLRNVGYGRAAELCFLGDRLDAAAARECGLVNQIYDDETFAPQAQAYAERLAAQPTRAIGLAKRALNHAWLATLEQQLEYEAFMQSTAQATADHRGGLRAFLQKQPPRFEGR